MMMLNNMPALLIFHISTAILGELIFVLTFLSSLIYLFKYKNLKTKRIMLGQSHVSLNALENRIALLSVCGLCFMTGSFISGIIVFMQGIALFPMGIFKIIWAILVWGFYLVAVLGRYVWGWRGRKAARLMVVGVILMVLGIFGVFGG
jgi:ABC-type uncharacterized transport system permease subunit